MYEHFSHQNSQGRVIRLIVILQLLLSFSIAIADPEIPLDKEIIYFEQSKLGPVTFLHKMHSTLDSVECATCHHKFEGTGQPEPCHNCHQYESTDDTPIAIKAFHTRCQGCHQYTVESGKRAGPVKKCILCHIKPD